MGFREAFLGAKIIKTSNFEALSSFGTQSSIIGWRVDQASFEKLQKLLQKAFLQTRDRLVHRQITAISAIQKELAQEEIELSYLIENHPNPFGIGIIVICSTIVAIFIPITFNYVTYTKKVTSRSKEIDKEIQQRKQDAKQQKTKIEEEYKMTKSKLEQELKELENMFEVCRNKRYL